MPDVTLFCEDSFHEKFVGALLMRLRDEHRLLLNVRILSARGGLPRMAGEFKYFLRDLSRDRYPVPDALIVVSDANCHGYHDRKGQLAKALERFPALEQIVSYAIPDPHVERWMLCDAKAFKSVFGRGCTLPAIKCQKDEYKRLLRDEIRRSGVDAPLGGEEFASDIVQAMDLGQIDEPSLALFIKQLRALCLSWKR